MNELLQKLQDKLGISAEQAQGAITHVMDYFKSKIPASMHEHLDAASIGETLKTKGSEFLAEAQSKGGDFMQAAQEKISSLLHSKEA
jgi:hypothetical protein